MITEPELRDNGFILEDNGWEHEKKRNVQFTLENGAITYVREDDNFYGITVDIRSMHSLLDFLTFL